MSIETLHQVQSRLHGALSAAALSCKSSSERQQVLYVTPEFGDYVKTGGLGDVSAVLPRYLRHHCDTRVLIPGYPQVLAQGGIRRIGKLPPAAGLPEAELGRLDTPDGLVVYVLLNAALYEREGTPYGDASGNDWADNDVRFARLSLAAADLAAGLGDPTWRPDLLHLNDWPAALAAGYVTWRGLPARTLLTIHNLAYQGLFGHERLDRLGIPETAFQVNGIEFYGKLSFLKAGIFYASHVTTVSETYAREITRPELGCGLDGLLRQRAEEGRLTGILNGIDESWDPRLDPQFLKSFDPLRWKSRHAAAVRKAFGLAASRGPLFAIVSRLVHQKGVDLAIEAAESLIDHGGQLVVTGRGEPRFEKGMKALAESHPDAVGVRIGFDQEEARRIFAGSDFLLMPSRFEPCGLSQMYAQRFGSLPIAHRTGGLIDTIEDGRTGFLFDSLTSLDLAGAIRRALETFRSVARLGAMRQAAMERSFGWRESAGAYAALYRRQLAGAMAELPAQASR